MLDIENCHNSEKIFNQTSDNFVKTVNQHAPLRSQIRKEAQIRAKPWISRGILKSIQTKNAMYKKCFKKNDNDLIEKYKKSPIK